MRLAHFTQGVLGGGNARGQGRASVMPDPVRRQSPRRRGPLSSCPTPHGRRGSPSRPRAEPGTELPRPARPNMLRNATFFRFFGNFEKPGFDARSYLKMLFGYLSLGVHSRLI